MMTEGLFSSKSNEWATPAQTFNQLDEEFHFNLDPCSTHENAKCERHFTIKEDGLKQDWGGQECFAILLTAEKSASGSRSATMRARTAKSWLCSFPPERTRLISTTTSITRPRKSASSVAGFISTIQSREHRSRQW